MTVNKQTLIYEEPPKMAAGLGGARPGSGPKKKGSKEAEQIADFNTARAKREHHNAAIAEMEAAKMAGELVSADEVLKEWQGIVANVRARLLALPSKLAARGHKAKTRGDLERILREGVTEALAELAGGKS